MMGSSSLRAASLLFLALGVPNAAEAKISQDETETSIIFANDRLNATVTKSRGGVTELYLDNFDLLGPADGNSGTGPYLDCYCIPSGFWTPGRTDPDYEVYSGTDSTGTDYAGVMMSDIYPETGQMLQQYWFLRDGETGLHMFSRVAYHNESAPFLRNLQELRTMFRPNTELWTHLGTGKDFYAPLPAEETQEEWTVVQDATWYLGNFTEDPYATEFADYFTKYTFAENWRDLKAHGMFADGSTTSDDSTFGAWTIMNSRDTYFGGPTHADLTVDGIVYNYISSNHHGNQTPNITSGFDRTFGPFYQYYNHFPSNSAWDELWEDAAQYADPEWNSEFYESIAKHVANYVPPSKRATFKLKVDLPKDAKKPIAILSQNGVDFQDNVIDTEAYQYWVEVDEDGSATIPMVKPDTYRLTVYADGVFGHYVQDDVVIKPKCKKTTHVRWKADEDGKEIWRIGTPDRSCGEYRHGYQPDPSHPLHPEEHRIYWGAYDFPTDFPDGVRFKIGESDEAKDWNYIHWTVFGPNFNRPEAYLGNGDVNNWTVVFDLDNHEVRHKKEATFTVQLAGVKTAAGNTDIFNTSEPYADLPYVVNVNGVDLEPWIIPWNQSSSCGVRSGDICYYVDHKFSFGTDLLKVGENELALSLPYNGTNYEPAMLSESLYVQYDALRLEIK